MAETDLLRDPAVHGPYFKFIAGANLRDHAILERLGCLFSLAGAAIIDVAAEPAVVEAVARGIATGQRWMADSPAWIERCLVGRQRPASAPVVMVSITLTGDRHTQIAVVNEETCIRCDWCTPVCPPGSIINGDVTDAICTGCGLCVPVCPPLAINLLPRPVSPDLLACWEAGARGLEVHTGAANEQDILAIAADARKWREMGGLLAYSIDGKQLGISQAVKLAGELGQRGVIIQADGNPISGQDGVRSTVPAVRLARAMLNAGVQAWVQPAGGTNNHTGRLAREFGIPIAGVGMGSFARRVAAPIEREPESERAWEVALGAAQRLVDSIRPGAGMVGSGCLAEASRRTDAST
jgi:Pyruvate/2-oxoacid:ferredoxin oxidoreductase delta subunit